ncbi:MAG: membrane protein insertion efficiency factor YidD [Leptospirales bacterium]|nr:membrane protein insertion efficiency factor YidD [Leptospirales bacterium]
MNHTAIALIRFYQRYPGRILGNRCRFYPTCSEYAAQCYEHYGFGRATWKSAWRILRCNPLSQGYFDPAVPDDSTATVAPNQQPSN